MKYGRLAAIVFASAVVAVGACSSDDGALPSSSSAAPAPTTGALVPFEITTLAFDSEAMYTWQFAHDSSHGVPLGNIARRNSNARST